MSKNKKFEVGQQWETQSGERAVIVGINDHDTHPVQFVVPVEKSFYRCKLNGRLTNIPCKPDLVKPWVETIIDEGVKDESQENVNVE